MKPTLKESLVGIVVFLLLMFVASSFSSCSTVDKTSCKAKISAQKKKIREAQKVQHKPYYARVTRKRI